MGEQDESVFKGPLRGHTVSSYWFPCVINTCREEAVLPLFSLLLQKEAL
jgi:hypothetical protein